MSKFCDRFYFAGVTGCFTGGFQGLIRETVGKVVGPKIGRSWPAGADLFVSGRVLSFR